MRSELDIFREQYRTGLDKLWAALGITETPPDVDVFTFAADKLARIRAMAQREVDHWNRLPRLHYDDYGLGRYRVAEDIMEILDE